MSSAPMHKSQFGRDVGPNTLSFVMPFVFTQPLYNGWSKICTRKTQIYNYKLEIFNDLFGILQRVMYGIAFTTVLAPTHSFLEIFPDCFS